MFEDQRRDLVKNLQKKGIHEPRVLKAIGSTARENFVPQQNYASAYLDQALQIAKNQTISQPYIVALMTQRLASHHHIQKILEVGTGSGYQSAILSQVFEQVFTVERIQTLLQSARNLFKTLKLNNIECQHSDGYYGWQEHAPFDGIIVTAAPPELPTKLLEQLNPNHGILMIPIGSGQTHILWEITRIGDTYKKEEIETVRFVPMVEGITP